MKENSDPDYITLIHRTCMAEKEEFFHNGLVIAGGNNLDYTTSRYEDSLSMAIALNGASGYRNYTNSDSRVIVMKIPRTALEYTPGKTKPILLKTDNAAEQSGGFVIIKDKFQTVLLPEYILGSIEYKNGVMTEFVENPGYTEIHDYQNDGLAFTEDVLDDFITTNRAYLESIIPPSGEEKWLGFDAKRYDRMSEKAESIMNSENIEYMKHPENFESAEAKRNINLRTIKELKRFSFKESTLTKIGKVIEKVKDWFTKERDDGDRG